MEQAGGKLDLPESEGQKQRLPSARALIKAPDILVLDEPTFELDSVIEQPIFDALPVFIRSLVVDQQIMVGAWF